MNQHSEVQKDKLEVIPGSIQIRNTGTRHVIARYMARSVITGHVQAMTRVLDGHHLDDSWLYRMYLKQQ